MPEIHLLRHGQAGVRRDYDRLSETGRLQARLLGEHLVREGARFDAVLCGSLERQRATAREVEEAYRRAGVVFPAISRAGDWDEFDIAGVYGAMAPRLAAADEEFRREFEAIMREQPGDGDSLKRTWSRCDAAVVRAWIEEKFPFDGESWRQFIGRVGGCRSALSGLDGVNNVAVFTSATPISIWVTLALEADGRHIFRLAGALYNASITSFRLSGGDLRLTGFNAASHLPPGLRTLR